MKSTLSNILSSLMFMLCLSLPLQSYSQISKSTSTSYCLCYKEKIKGVFQSVTTCRRTLRACRRLSEKVQRGTKILQKGSVSHSCTQVFGAKAPLVLGDVNSWTSSKRAGNYFYPHSCLLKRDHSKLNWVSTNGTYDVESFPVSPKLKRALGSEEMREAPVPIDELLKLSDIPRVWTVITKRTSITTNLVSINVDGCGASACTYSCNMKNKVRDTLLVMPRDVFPKSRAERLVGLRISTERDTDESHVISKSALSKLRSNLNSEFKQADRHSDQDKTLCGLEHIKVFKLPKGATWSHLIYCRVERSEAPRRLVQKLEGSSPAPFSSPFFTGIYLYDGVSEVRLVSFQEFNDASAIITPPTVSFSLDGLGDYIMYGSSYYEGQADHVFTLKHGFLEQITLFADGA